MKRFIIKTLLLTAGLLLVCAAYVMIQVVLSRDKVGDIFALGDDTEMIMLGASEIGCSFVESDSLKNRIYWNSGSALFFNRARIEALVKANGGLKHVKYCVLVLNPHCPAWYLDKMRFSKNICVLLPIVWRYFRELSWDQALRASVYVLQSRWGKCARIVEKVPGETLPWSRRTTQEREKYLNDEWTHHYSWLALSENEISAVEAMMERDIDAVNATCKKYGVQLIIVATPHASDYWSGVPDAALQRHVRWVGACRRKGAIYFDMMKTMPDECFRDECHLLLSGAKKFTELFSERFAGIKQ